MFDSATFDATTYILGAWALAVLFFFVLTWTHRDPPDPPAAA